MASFITNGLDSEVDFFERLVKLPENVLEEMLGAQESVVVKAQKAAAPKNTGKMAESITGGKKKRTWEGIYMDVYPKGVHHNNKKSRYRNAGGGSRSTTNAEVAFIHEFGAPGRNITAKQWIKKANDESEIEAVEASEKVLNTWIDKL